MTAVLWLRRGLAIVNKSSATQTAYATYRAVIQSLLTACVQFHRYAAKLSMNSTANGSSESWSCFDQFNSTALKIGGTVTFCLFIIVSLVANSPIVIIVCLICCIQYFGYLGTCPSCTPMTCFLSMVSLGRPCVSLSLSLLPFLLPCRFRIWFS